MKNITLSADEELIAQARRVAGERHTTLNALFREWLSTMDPGALRVRNYRSFMDRAAKRAKPGDRKFTRDEMNER